MAIHGLNSNTEMIHDPKIGRLSEHPQLVFVKVALRDGRI